MAVIAFMAGMLYLPRLFVYHSETVPGSESSERFKVMETRLLKGIVGLEMVIERIEGKWKVSQNQTEANRRGIIEGLETRGDAASLAIAKLVQERG